MNTEHKEITLSQATDMLSYIDPSLPLNEWFPVCAAMFTEFENNARSVVEEWSKGSDKYKSSEFNAHWKSIKSGHYRIGTVIKLALSNGYRFPQSNTTHYTPLKKTRKQIKAKPKPKPISNHSQTPNNPFETFLLNTSPADSNHPYLKRKSLKPYHARQSKQGVLLIPLLNNQNQLCGIQRIWADGQKKHMKGSMLNCSRLFIGSPEDNSNILICEGYATGNSLFQATKIPVCIVFSCQNLFDVTLSLLSQFPKHSLFLCYDDDSYDKHGRPKENIGFIKALESLNLSNRIHLVHPKAKEIKRVSLDFNDLHQIYGLDYIKSLLMNKIKAVNEGKCTDIEYRQPRTYPDLPFQSHKKNNIACFPNFEYLMQCLGVTIQYNQDNNRIITNLDTQDTDIVISKLKDTCLKYCLKFKDNEISNYVKTIAHENVTSPAKKFILSHQWDGQDRLENLTDTLPYSDGICFDGDLGISRKYNKMVLQKWLLQVVTAIFMTEPTQLRYVLTLSGDQGCGKTSFFNRLFQDIKGFFKDGMLLEPENKDCIIKVLNYGCIEIGEADATFRKTDIARLKAFFSEKHYTLRLPYDRTISEYIRRTVFCASVNDYHFLNDPSGNTRFWVIDIPKGNQIEYDHNIDMQQVFAQLYEDFYLKGISFVPKHDEAQLIDQVNSFHTTVSPMEERLLTHFNKNTGLERTEFMNVTTVLEHIGYRNPTKRDTNEMGNLLRKHGFEITRKDKRWYAMPKPLKSPSNQLIF